MRLHTLCTLSILATCAFFGACQTVSHPIQTSANEANSKPNAMKPTLPLPKIPAAKLFQHPIPQIMTLDNGMPLWYVQNSMIPLVSMKILFDEGASGDTDSKAGCTSMTASMLKEGALGKSAQELSDSIEILGATLSPSVTQDGTGLSLQALSQFFPQALDILSDIWLHPDFDETSFNRLKKIALTRLQQRADAPQAMAKLASDRIFYGDNHPYARSVDGYTNTIQSLTLNDVKSRYTDIFSPSRAAIIAVGNLPPETFKNLVNQKFGSLPREPISRKTVVEKSKNHSQKLAVVDKPNAPQTIIRIYQPAVESTSLKTLTWQFLNIPYGDSFTSRLMQNIREDKGFSYGANAIVSALKYDGVLISSSAVASEATGDALREFLYELKRLPTGDFTQEEFERARETWKSELVQSFETQSGVLGTIAGLYANNKPVNAINDFAKKIQTFTLDDFNAIAREFPTIDQATIVLVGDKNTILKQIVGMELPDPIFCNAEGYPIP